MAKVALISKDKALADLVTEFLEEDGQGAGNMGL
jgi:hypothetical protein